MFGSNNYDNGVIYPLLRCMRILTHRQKLNLIEYFNVIVIIQSKHLTLILNSKSRLEQ